MALSITIPTFMQLKQANMQRPFLFWLQKSNDRHDYGCCLPTLPAKHRSRTEGSHVVYVLIIVYIADGIIICPFWCLVSPSGSDGFYYAGEWLKTLQYVASTKNEYLICMYIIILFALSASKEDLYAFLVVIRAKVPRKKYNHLLL